MSKHGRRFVWLIFGGVFLALCAIRPQVDVQVMPSVRGVYDKIESLPPRSPLLVSVDYSPSFAAELNPLTAAICRHAFRKNLRVIGVSLTDSAVGTAQDLLAASAAPYGRTYGADYVYLGWKPAEAGVVTGLGLDIAAVFPSDFRGTPVALLPALDGIKTLGDFPFAVQIGAGFQSIPAWIAYASDRYGLKIAIGCNAGAEPSLRPFFASGQIAGLIPSIEGAAQYEKLLGHKGEATTGLGVISYVQLGLAAMIILLNIPPFWRRKK